MAILLIILGSFPPLKIPRVPNKTDDLHLKYFMPNENAKNKSIGRSSRIPG
jgi:hypothetical protein